MNCAEQAAVAIASVENRQTRCPRRNTRSSALFALSTWFCHSDRSSSILAALASLSMKLKVRSVGSRAGEAAMGGH
jgi:hypothetical protein